jgi:hypothetical protein
MEKSTQNKVQDMELRSVDSNILSSIVSAFRPDEIGLSAAWNEFYLACQAADASHEFLRAIHDIKESIEDAEQGV